MITRPICFENENYNVISYMDIIYKNSFNYTFDYDILNNIIDKYIEKNKIKNSISKQLIQVSKIEKKFVEFWIDRLKLKTIDDFNKWFNSMFKTQNNDIKYENYKT